MQPKRPTSTDVAKRAGVSRATVSYVLNGRQEESIPEATRTKVIAAATALDYTPHAAARALRGGQSNIVLLAVRNVPYGRSLGLLVDRLAEDATRAGLTLVVWRPAAGESLRTMLGHLQPRLALSYLPLADDEVQALKAAGVPFVAGAPTPGVSAMDELIGSVQVHHLAERGHRIVGHLGTDDEELAAFAGPRRGGVRRECLELGLPAPYEASVPVPPRGSVDVVTEILSTWRSLEEPVTGVAAYNDYLAASCVRAATRLGLRVPEDLAVVGVDDDPMSALFDPPLSTVRIDVIQLADRLMDLARAITGGSEEPASLRSHSVELVARGSS